MRGLSNSYVKEVLFLFFFLQHLGPLLGARLHVQFLVSPGHLCGGFPSDTSGKEPACQTRRHKDQGVMPGSGRFPGRGNGNPFHHSCLGLQRVGHALALIDAQRGEVVGTSSQFLLELNQKFRSPSLLFPHYTTLPLSE